MRDPAPLSRASVHVQDAIDEPEPDAREPATVRSYATGPTERLRPESSLVEAEVAEDDPRFNWRTMGNRSRGVILSDGSRRTVSPREFDRLRSEGKLSDRTPKLRGDGAPAGGGRGASSSEFERLHPRAQAGTSGGTGGQFIRAGSSGDDVRAVQRKVGADPDGRYGNRTRRKVREFQRRHGLQVDGVVGRQTALALRGRYATARRTRTGALEREHRELLRESTGDTELHESRVGRHRRRTKSGSLTPVARHRRRPTRRAGDTEALEAAAATLSQDLAEAFLGASRR